MTSLVLLAAFFVAAVATRHRARWGVVFAACLLLTLAGLDVVLMAPDLAQIHYGIAPGAPTLELSQLLLVVTLACIWSTGGRLAGTPVILVFIPLCLVLYLTYWGREVPQQAGIVLMVASLLAFGVGSWLATQRDCAALSVIAVAAAGVCVLQALAALAQSQGILVFGAADPEASSFVIDGGRMVGLDNHPSTLGKNTFLLLALLLPLSTSKVRFVRVSAQFGIAAGVVGTLLTLSRANAAATASALMIWVFINRRDISPGVRVATSALFVGAVLSNLAAVNGLIARNAEDPTGGQRGVLMEIGLEQIANAPWVGIGPNFYSEYVGNFDRFAALGFPVHNTFLLAAAEIGIPLAIIFFLPLFLAARSAYSRWRRSGRIDSRTAAFVSMLPGTLVITWTGWGMLAEASLPLWFLALGYLTDVRSRMIPEPRPDEHLAEPGRAVSEPSANRQIRTAPTRNALTQRES